jgi:predicted RecB family endonuclease
MAPAESGLRTRIVKALNQYSGVWFVIWQDGHQEKGMPDIIGCYQGKFYGIEVKLPGKLHTVTKRQAYVIKKINDSGGRATVVTTVQEAMSFVFGGGP